MFTPFSKTTSDATISFMSDSRFVFGSQPSIFLALDASPQRASTSVGLK